MGHGFAAMPFFSIDTNSSCHRLFQSCDPMFVVFNLWCQSFVDIPKNSQNLIICFIESREFIIEFLLDPLNIGP